MKLRSGLRLCLVVLSVFLLALLQWGFQPEQIQAAQEKVDPALKQEMARDPGMKVPVILEMAQMGKGQPDGRLADQAVALLKGLGRDAGPVGPLPLVNGAAGYANARALEALARNPRVAFIHADVPVQARESSYPSDLPPSLAAPYPLAVRADRAWSAGATGKGVTVAVLDSGIALHPDLRYPSNRILAAANFAGDLGGMPDAGGHGTHVAGIIAGNSLGADPGQSQASPFSSTSGGIGDYLGVAPGANLVDVRVLNAQGNGRISAVIKGVQWVLKNKDRYNIRVINLSFGAPARSSYRQDPLGAALEIAWKRGVVVVAAAGNGGPASGSVETPGIDPYLITVGATDDAATSTTADDQLASFSSWGTPLESRARPDVVAPGRRIVSLRVAGSTLDRLYPDRVVAGKSGSDYFRMSGTSMSTAVVSGVVADMLQVRPGLRPDQVKAVLIGTVQPYGTDSIGLPDPSADGSGLVDAGAAVVSPIQGTANQGLRPADSLARALYPILYGQPLRWKDPSYAGIDWNNLAWDNLAWDNLAWDNLAWDNLAWDNLAWDNLAWDNLAWDNLAWDNLAWDNLAWDAAGPSGSGLD